MDDLDTFTLILLACLVLVALLFPLSAGRHRASSERPDDRSD